MIKICKACSGPVAGASSNEGFCSRKWYLAYPKLAENERFWSKVQKTEACWLWTAKRNKLGYGQFWAACQRLELAHRTAWRLARRSIPEGILILHKCDNPACVRPDHLFEGSSLDNYHDCARKGRMPTHFGENNGNTKLAPGQVDLIRQRYVRGVISLRGLAREFGVSTTYISHIVHGHTQGGLKAFSPSLGILSFGT